MNVLQTWSDLVVNSANEFWQEVGTFLPKLLGAIVLVIVGVLVAKAAEAITEKVLEFVGANKVKKNKTVSDTLKNTGLDIDYVSVASRIVFWVVIVIFAMTVADVLELTAMRDVISALLAYLPHVLAAAIVLTVTVAGARLARDLVVAGLSHMGVDYSLTVGAVVRGAIVLFGTLMALDQLGFDTTILAANITLIVAGVVFALSLAFGLGGRDLAANWLSDVISRNSTKAVRRTRR